MSSHPLTETLFDDTARPHPETGGRQRAGTSRSALAESAARSVELFAFGPFTVLKDGAPLIHCRKTPKKPIALLKAILALGGRDVSGRHLSDALWPDEEGDAARNVLAVNLHRLRRLLGENDAVVLHDGRVSLDARRCWADTWTFERLLGSAAEASSEARPILLQRALALYRGPFLAGDPDEPWALSMRERLRAKFIRHSVELGRLLEESGQWDQAIACYQRGLEGDEFAEAFYQGLMRCYRQLDRRAEGVAVYRRLCRTLSVILGLAASPASEALFRELLT
jgi:DNA-binding SARP family transcriptional activator